MLGQPALQDLGHNLFLCIHPGADGARIQVGTKAGLQVGWQPPALRIQQMKPRLLAIHPALYLA
jgi:hypothetical protein